MLFVEGGLKQKPTHRSFTESQVGGNGVVSVPYPYSFRLAKYEYME